MILMLSFTIAMVSCSDVARDSAVNAFDDTLVKSLGAQIPKIDFSSSLDIQVNESAEYPCDPIVVHPNSGIDYTIREIQPKKNIDYSLEVTDPGKHWCRSIAYEELKQQFKLNVPEIEENLSNQ